MTLTIKKVSISLTDEEKWVCPEDKNKRRKLKRGQRNNGDKCDKREMRERICEDDMKGKRRDGYDDDDDDDDDGMRRRRRRYDEYDYEE